MRQFGNFKLIFINLQTPEILNIVDDIYSFVKKEKSTNFPNLKLRL